MRKVLGAVLAAVTALAIGTPARSAAQTIREPTTFFVSAPFCFPDDSLIQVDGTAVITVVGEGTRLIEAAIVANGATGVDTGQTYRVNFGFSGVFPHETGQSHTTDRLTIVGPDGQVLISRVITVFRFNFNTGDIQVDFDLHILKCKGAPA